MAELPELRNWEKLECVESLFTQEDGDFLVKSFDSLWLSSIWIRGKLGGIMRVHFLRADSVLSCKLVCGMVASESSFSLSLENVDDWSLVDFRPWSAAYKIVCWTCIQQVHFKFCKLSAKLLKHLLRNISKPEKDP